jgi:glycosyltransferase involved in cell wall biosynthesis
LSTPLITVCIVVLNGAQTIAASIASVIDQTYPAIELIVVDGGSTDGTIDVVNAFAQRITRFVSGPDEGIYDAMNKCCEMAQGDWLIFLGCDDILVNSLSTVGPLLKKRDAVYYGNVIIKADGTVSGGKFSKYRIMQENICHQAIFYPKSVYKKWRYNLKYRLQADHEYNIRLIGSGIEYVFLKVTVAVFNNTGVSAAGDPTFRRDLYRILRQNFGTTWTALKWLRTLTARAVKPILRSFAKSRS